MTIHDDARKASEGVYDAALAAKDVALGDLATQVDELRRTVETVTADRNLIATALAASEAELATALARIAELEEQVPSGFSTRIGVYNGSPNENPDEAGDGTDRDDAA